MTASRHCPGGCGRLIESLTYACRACWRRLPVPIRRVITRTWDLGQFHDQTHGPHANAKAAAARWYARNPLPEQDQT